MVNEIIATLLKLIVLGLAIWEIKDRVVKLAQNKTNTIIAVIISVVFIMGILAIGRQYKEEVSARVILNKFTGVEVFKEINIDDLGKDLKTQTNKIQP